MIKTIAKYVGITLGAGLLCANASAVSWDSKSIGGLSTSVYVPATSSPIGEGRALLIVLHGCTQANTAFQTANLDKAAEEYGMVIAVPDAAEKKGYNCWGYWTDGRQGAPRGRDLHDYKRVHDLTKEMIADSSYDIDPSQVYIAGLSSGGAFAMTLGCMSPDLYAGMGLDASPSAGTSSTGAFAKEGTASSVAADCKSFSEGREEYFATQITATGYGTSDYLVPTGYAQQNAEAMASIYGVSKLSGTNSIENKATETLWSGLDDKNQVSMLKFDGVDHAWPGGSGASGSYINDSSINYGMYLGEFFSKNNLRVETKPCEGLECVKIKGLKVDAPEAGSTATVIATVELPEIVANYTVIVDVDGKAREAAGTSINETFEISQGDHTVKITVTAYGADNSEVVVEKTSAFNNEKKVVVPSWCSYIPTEYWHYVSACAAGL